MGQSSSSTIAQGDSIAIPPPTSVLTLQNISINRCAVPPEELTEAVLLAEHSKNVTNQVEGSLEAGVNEDLTSSSA